MTATVANLIAEPATLTVGTYGQAEGSAQDVGALEGGVETEFSQETYDIKADPWMGVVGVKKINESFMIKVMMSEITLANLAIAYGYAAGAVAGGVFSFGGDSDIIERTLYINGKGPSGGDRKLVIHKAVVKGSAPVAYKKGDKSLIEVEFHALQDTSQAADAQFGTITDTGGDTTAPTIVLTTPADGGTVTKDTLGTVLWTITDAGQIDEGSIIYGDTVNIINTTTPASAALVAGSIVYDASAKTITFTPSATWTASDTFQAIITTGLRDMSGNHLAAIQIEQFSATA